MDRHELDFVINQNEYLKGGTKEACIKAKEFLKNATSLDGKVSSRFSCVSSDEFVEAVKTLIAYSFCQEDKIPQTWYCDNDCRRVYSLLCPGECNVRKDATNLCPYHIEED